MTTLLGVWRFTVSSVTGPPSVGRLWLGETESLHCNFYLSVAACTIVSADLSLRYTGMLLGRKASKQATDRRWGHRKKHTQHNSTIPEDDDDDYGKIQAKNTFVQEVLLLVLSQLSQVW